MARYRPELLFVRSTVSWRFWALGWHWMPSKSRRYRVLTIALGPVRFQFLAWDFAAQQRAKADFPATSN